MMYYYPGFGLGWIVELIFCGVIIWLLLSLFRGGGMGYRHRYFGQNRALDILQERYVKGEITKEQYEEMKKNLNS